MCNDADYPRTLIVGESFDRFTGGGITLRNLFADWPLDSIAVAAGKRDFTDWDSCKRYYRLGREEMKGIWPFYRAGRAMASGPVQPGSPALGRATLPAVPAPVQNRSGIRRMASACMGRLGVSEWVTDSCVSARFLEWVRAFSPEVIYTQLGSITAIRFIRRLVTDTHLALVIHVMDDWPAYMPEHLYAGHIGGRYLRRRFDRQFRAVLQCAARRLGICQAMCDAYHLRYGGEWQPFHNPVNLSSWQLHARNQWKKSCPFRLLYGGRIGRGIWNSLVDIARAISELAQGGTDIIFEIRTPDQGMSVVAQLRKLAGVQVLPPLPYDEVAGNLAHADLLVIPYDFDDYSAICSRLSMPTKMAEYMASGTPILLYAPRDFAITQYALAEQWGMTVTVLGVPSLKAAISCLLKDAGIRERFARQAMLVAERNHSAANIRVHFRQVLRKEENL